MPAKRGSELLIKRGDSSSPETFTTVGALRSGTVRFNGNPIDVTTFDDVDANDQVWRTYITGLKELTVSGDGLGKAIEPVQSVYEDFAGGAIVNYSITIPYVGTWVVPMQVSSMEFTGAVDGAVTFSLELVSNGAPDFTAESA